MKLNARERVLLVVGGAGLVVVAALLGGVIYGAYKAEVGTLRWWAVGATVALPLVGVAAFYLGRMEARGHVAGLRDGIEAVHASTQRTVETASRVADVRVTTRQRMKRKPTPAIQQVILPGMTGGATGGAGLILPPVQDSGDDVEL
jgi:hypothetical protein